MAHWVNQRVDVSYNLAGVKVMSDRLGLLKNTRKLTFIPSSSNLIDQDRQQPPHQHHQRQYSQSNRNSYGQQSQQPSVATQQTSLTPAGGLPLLSPSSMLSSPDYQSS